MSSAGSRPGTAARLPSPRGPLSRSLLPHLRRAPHDLDREGDAALSDALRGLSAIESPLDDDDLHLALYCCYELHYQGFAEVDDGWEWEPALLAFRSALEAHFLLALIDEIGPPVATRPHTVERALHTILESGDGPSLSSFVERQASLGQLRELAMHRSAYQLKEADPHTWAIPRLSGAPKAALVHIQADEYGNGRTAGMHAELFRSTMRALDLDDRYGAYLDRLPGVTLATVNLVSLFGLHRRWRGALTGHLAIFEMASVVPMSRYAAAVRRLGLSEEAATFFDVHVEADITHEIVASRQLAAALAAAEPALAGDVLFGARALMVLEERFSRHLLDAWHRGGSSLLEDEDAAAVAPVVPIGSRRRLGVAG